MVRTVVFWLHLAAGVLAGSVILLMSATGVALTYERQLNAWTTSHLRSTPPSDDAEPMPIEALVAGVLNRESGRSATGVTLGARRDAAVTIMADPAPMFVDAYTGRELGDRRGAGIRSVLQTMRSWHRWLAMDGEGRSLGRAITGWSNLLFVFVVLSGIYLWFPKRFRWEQLRQGLWFKRRYGTSKARDFNWHRVIGIWSAVPLLVIVVGALPMSFTWANDALYRLAGEAPPQRGPLRGDNDAAARRHPGTRETSQPSLAGLEAALMTAKRESGDWRTISVRFPRQADAPLVFSIDAGDGGQPQRRSTLTVSRTGEVVSREGFGDQGRGRQLRSLLRFAHTGEVFGIIGQTVAGLASAGAVLMVWTGLALSWRRLAAWRVRRVEASSSARTRSALADAPALSSQESLS